MARLGQQQLDEPVQSVIGRERELLQPAVRADPDAVRRLLHPDFVEFGSSGRVWTVDTVTVALAADPGQAVPELTEVEAIPLSHNTILLTYRTATSLRSSIWLHVEGSGWLLRFHQGTPAERSLD